MMNTNVMPSIVQIEGEELRQLVQEVKETLATNVKMGAAFNRQKKFGLADLWNCHNRRRTAASLRRI